MYMCDICTKSFPAKADGTFFDQNRVLTSPSYWEHCFGKPDFVEGMLGMYLGMFCQDTSGYTVCDACARMLDDDGAKAERYGISEYVRSSPSGRVDSHAVGMVAGTVWKNLHGSWPSTIQIGGSDNPHGTLRAVERSKGKTSGCFVATVAYGGEDAWEVEALRAFRDKRLAISAAGRILIHLYYRWGPGLARIVQCSSSLRSLARFVLGGLARRSRNLVDRR